MMMEGMKWYESGVEVAEMLLNLSKLVGLENVEVVCQHLEGLNFHSNLFTDDIQKILHFRVHIVHGSTEQHSYFKHPQIPIKLQLLISTNLQPIIKQSFLDLVPQNSLIFFVTF